MKLLKLSFVLLCAVQAALAVPANDKSNPAGQELASELRAAQPEESSEISGVLKIATGKRHEEIPVLSKIVLQKGTYETIYLTKETARRGAEQLKVIHSTNSPNQYFYAKAAGPTESLPPLESITPAKASTISFAGSDFTLADLGLDFLQWPQQKRLKAPGTRLGRDCYLLESQNPDAPEMVRIVSWIDKETNGLLIADGYSEKEKVKEFSLSGSSFTKINGRWQLEKMTIRSPQKKSETILQFNLPKE